MLDCIYIYIYVYIYISLICYFVCLFVCLCIFILSWEHIVWISQWNVLGHTTFRGLTSSPKHLKTFTSWRCCVCVCVCVSQDLHLWSNNQFFVSVRLLNKRPLLMTLISEIYTCRGNSGALTPSLCVIRRRSSSQISSHVFKFDCTAQQTGTLPIVNNELAKGIVWTLMTV